jgi:hypothetical protein
MLIDAARFAGPAMWQAIMVLLLPVAAWGMWRNGGEHLWHWMAGYVAAGVVLLPLIMWWAA